MIWKFFDLFPVFRLNADSSHSLELIFVFQFILWIQFIPFKYVEAWSSMVKVYWTLESWYNIYVHFLNGIRTISSRENCSPPSPVRVKVRVCFRVGGVQFSLGATVLGPLWIYQEQMEEHIRCRRIMYIPSNFWILKGS